MLAVHPVKAWSALAGVRVHIVGARASVKAWMAGALVYVQLTPLAVESRGAGTGEGINQVHAGAAIPTRIWPAVVDIRLAVRPRVAPGACAAVSTIRVVAQTAMLAGAGQTFVHILSTSAALPATAAAAGEVPEVMGVSTGASVSTGV